MMAEPRHTGTLLDPIGRTPLAARRSIGQGAPVPILVKCEHLNPGGSVKDRLAPDRTMSRSWLVGASG
ncbi:MAG TPA: hypothetical protein VFS00_15030 [Polyangiaceae bacterium]|nr:hypothetical protein [Polyangiaceae bacterium]